MNKLQKLIIPALVLVIAFVWALVFKAVFEKNKPESTDVPGVTQSNVGGELVFTIGSGNDEPSESATTNIQELLHQTEAQTTATTESQKNTVPSKDETTTKQEPTTLHNYANVTRNGTYTSRDEVAKYIKQYKTLPSNYITSARAKALGWKEAEGNLAQVAPGKSIGGDGFDDPEKLLPEKAGRTWKQCDINYTSGLRGAEYIVYSNDGLVFYTPDHYKSFTQLY
ncbi:MAG: ribonuclease [Clostridiales bacterium]|nr:ribonuclease [Clostridiales bacterium]